MALFSHSAVDIAAMILIARMLPDQSTYGLDPQVLAAVQSDTAPPCLIGIASGLMINNVFCLSVKPLLCLMGRAVTQVSSEAGLETIL